MSTELPYDRKDKYAILKYAQLLTGKSLRMVIQDKLAPDVAIRLGKGGFGTMVEDLYFDYRPNSDAQADFPEAGIELKTTPLKVVQKGLVSKERLVFNIINYMEEHQQVFRTSSFWKKNAELLLLFYIHDKEKALLDYQFKIVRLWRFPETDLKIIIDDWNTIVKKIREGKAHELSEGDTMYLGACTKGATKASLRSQPFSEDFAMQRAFSLKSKYLNFIVEQSLNGDEHAIDEREYEYLLSESVLSREEYELSEKVEPPVGEQIVRSVSEYKQGQTFEDLVVERFAAYIGWSEAELIAHFKLNIKPNAKNRYQVICNRIMGVTGKYIEEFEKGEVAMKTVMLQHNGNLKESMSFQQIKYQEIVHEDWLESYFYQALSKRFFFVVFQQDNRAVPRLFKVKFWTMPLADLMIAEAFWEDTKSKIAADSFDNFIKIADDQICHVRPKARDSQDLMLTASGRMEKKKAYWLNSSYIKEVVLTEI
ncbi:MutH/Sau3AI family endonuclease [Sphingobacterium sp. SG20118]|uniref:MutH/Sau3AI family endonuclease n=1 Tax=Sphingobacterium sp. SG20118 TaxID=3367156 RepID=UPI0037DFC75A